MILKFASFLSFGAQIAASVVETSTPATLKWHKLKAGELSSSGHPQLVVPVWIPWFPSPIPPQNSQIPGVSVEIEQNILQWKIGEIINL